MTVGEAVLGRIRFRDIQYGKDAEFVVRVDATKGEIILFLDQDVDAVGGFYSGECQIGMELDQPVFLLRLLRKAVTPLPESREGPAVVGRVAFRWSDPEAVGPDAGITTVGYSGRVILGIAFGEASIADAYITTFPHETAEELVAALTRAVSTVHGPQGT